MEQRSATDDSQWMDIIRPVRSARNETLLQKTISCLSNEIRSADSDLPYCLQSQVTRELDAVWEVDDKRDPQNWSTFTKCGIVFSCTFSSASCILFSSSYLSGLNDMRRDIGISNEVVSILGLTTYLLGCALGSLLWAPISEIYGRRVVYIATWLLASVFVIPCAMARNTATMMTARFFVGRMSCSSVSNSPGTINDIVKPSLRPFAFSCWSIGVMNGPVLGPILGGVTAQYLGWRWIHWISLILNVLSLIMMACVPETYKAVLVRRDVASKHKTNEGVPHKRGYDDLFTTSDCSTLRTALCRPFQLTATEPILWFWDAYIMILCANVYLTFVLYPKIFQGLRGWPASTAGLAYLGMGLGDLLVSLNEPIIRRITNKKNLTSDGKPTPESKLFIVSVGAIALPLGGLVFAWTCTPNVHWIVPIVAGIPFMGGTSLVFIYGCNYIAHIYGQYAASALAGNVFIRVIAGATIPLAGPRLWAVLGANWSGMLLGIVELLMIPIPFYFYRYGGKLRARRENAT